MQRVRFTGTTNTLHILCGDTVHNGLVLLAQPVKLKAGGACENPTMTATAFYNKTKRYRVSNALTVSQLQDASIYFWGS